MSDVEVKAVLDFWFVESSFEQWFQKNDDFDREIKRRFSGLHTDLMGGHRNHWRENMRGCLAEIIVLDQFSRNMFRNDPKSFASDSRAKECLNHLLAQGYDSEMTQVERNFAYLPLEHSEELSDQERSIELFTKNGDENSLDYAKRHKVIIDRFGRFPHRNAILGRVSTAMEIEFLNEPGSSF